MAHEAILVVDDEPAIVQVIRDRLLREGFQVRAAGSAGAALSAVTAPLDLIILDLMLPDGNGLEWLSELREESNRPPALILTARDAVEDRVEGLDAGADDYVVKPFAFEELLARIRVLLRRDLNARNTTLSLRDLKVDLLSRTASRGGEMLELQNRQFELLVFLMENANEVVTREMIAQAVWKEATATWTNVIQVHINQLRKKLERPGQPPILHTIRGEGYLLGDAR